jgi:hypothetical protein
VALKPEPHKKSIAPYKSEFSKRPISSQFYSNHGLVNKIVLFSGNAFGSKVILIFGQFKVDKMDLFSSFERVGPVFVSHAMGCIQISCSHVFRGTVSRESVSFSQGGRDVNTKHEITFVACFNYSILMMCIRGKSIFELQFPTVCN